jgi:tryptophan synthase alpha chain
MSRIDTAFEKRRLAGQKTLVGFLTAGDPDEAQSERDIREALDAGVDVLELGIPFSDPTADGPTIQAASQRALAAGMTLENALGMVSRIRADYDCPIILFGYSNLFFQYGFECICGNAAEAGADGMLVVDLPFEECDELRQHLERNEMVFVPLVAPTTPPARLAIILKEAKGFVYYIMVTGVTGARQGLAENLSARLQALRDVTPLPIAAGFGVSNGKQAADAARDADGIVVGSALIAAARDGNLGDFVREIRSGLDGMGA